MVVAAVAQRPWCRARASASASVTHRSAVGPLRSASGQRHLEAGEQRGGRRRRPGRPGGRGRRRRRWRPRRSRPRSSQRPSSAVVVERLEPEQRRAAEQRRVDLEVRVLGGGADQHEQAALDRRQQGVLLGLVEPVDLVEEQDRALPVLAEAVLGLGGHLADVLHAGGHRRQRLERLAVVPAMSRASVVLPVPGGPQRITDDSRSASIRARSGRPGPSRWSWPTTSSSVAGRRRSASGPSRRVSAPRPH